MQCLYPLGDPESERVSTFQVGEFVQQDAPLFVGGPRLEATGKQQARPQDTPNHGHRVLWADQKLRCFLQSHFTGKGRNERTFTSRQFGTESSQAVSAPSEP